MKPLLPAFEENNVSVVFASDTTYLPYASVLLASLLAHASQEYHYDLFLLGEGDLVGLSLLMEQASAYSNVTLRTVDVTPRFKELNLPTHSHISRATYYRLCLPSLFENFSRMIYLDIDVLIQEDLAKLFNVDLGGRAIGACLDLAQRLWRKEGKKVYYPYYKGASEDYLSEYLGLSKPQNYFQAGVLLLDLKKLRADHMEEKFFSIIESGKRLHWMDQDILNIVFNEDGFRPLEPRWNFVALDRLPSRLPDLALSYEEARKRPAIIHYASGAKPWFNPLGELNLLWWRVAEMTPFADQIEEKLISNERHEKGLSFRLKRRLNDETFLGKLLREIRSWFRRK